MRQVRVALSGQLGCSLLPARIASWRYQRGARTLLSLEPSKGKRKNKPNTTFPLCQTQKPNNNNNLTEYSPEIEEHELKQNLKITVPGKYLSNENDFSRKKPNYYFKFFMFC